MHELIWHIYRILILHCSAPLKKERENRPSLIHTYDPDRSLMNCYQSTNKLCNKYDNTCQHKGREQHLFLMIVWAIGVQRQAQRWHSDQIKHKTYTCFCLHKQCQAYDGTVGIPPTMQRDGCEDCKITALPGH